ncbi:MAG: hypothetical protein ACOY9Y_05170 [Bacillota bacterium]
MDYDSRTGVREEENLFMSSGEVKPRVKYCYLGNTSGYPAAAGNFQLGFPYGTHPVLVILEDDLNSSGTGGARKNN